MVARHIPQIMAIGAILAAYRLLGGHELFETFHHKELKEEYDYIIVGGGTAGAVLASRIAENDTVNILLLEAGGDPEGNQDIDVPISADRLLGSAFDWDYHTVPQKHACKGHVDGVSRWRSGKGLGGTSLINHMEYIRGSRHDYDEWANHGAQGWEYKEILPYFIKPEDNKNGRFLRTVFHGFGGRMTVTDTQSSPVNKIMESAFKEFGVKKRDTNGRNKFGYSHTQATIRNGVRWSTDKAFLRRSLMWDNLYAMTGAIAQKIVFEGKKAVGVEFMHKGELKSSRGKEIILTAGTIGSTKLLLLSGVGPKAHLTAMKIPVVADLPVGENLQDHVTAGGIEFYTPFSVSVTPAKAENFLSSWRYSLFGKGMKMSPRFREGIAFLRTRQQPQHIKYPLIALEIVSNIGVYSHEQLNLKEHIWESLHGNPPQKEGFTIFAKLLHPRSKGTIRLRSTNPEDPPLINPNYLAEDIDVKTLSEAYQVARKLANTKAMKDWELEINDNLIAPCQKFGNYTREYIECFLKHVTLPGDNPVGTCKLGAAGDPTAVVDPLLRVRGVKNLRVIDASVIPNAISGNVYTTQVMMAEKMADTLLERDSVKPIVEYFRHMLEVKHKKVAEDEDQTATVAQDKKSR